MALDQETERLADSDLASSTEVAPESAAADATSFSEGPIPHVAPDGTTTTESASELAFDKSYNLDSGIHEWDAYEVACASGSPSKWKPEYVDGWTSAQQFKQPIDHGKPHAFELKKGTSASNALKDFMAGLTVTDWFAYRMGVDLMNLLDDMGWQAFDRMFGSTYTDEDMAIPDAHRMVISSQLHHTMWVEDLRKLAFADPEPMKQPAELSETKPVEEDIAEDKVEAQTETVTVDDMMLTEREREQVG